MQITGWGDLFLFLFIVAIGETGKYLDQDSRYYTCPCYCEVEHEHVGRKNDRCEQTFQMAIQDSCTIYTVQHNDVHRVDSNSYSECFSKPLSRIDISLIK